MRRRTVTDEQKTIIRTLTGDGWTVQRIADKLGMPYATVAYHSSALRREAVLRSAKARYDRLLRAVPRQTWVRSGRDWPKPGEHVVMLLRPEDKYPIVGWVDVFNPSIWVTRTETGAIHPVNEPAHWSPIPPLPKASVHAIR